MCTNQTLMAVTAAIQLGWLGTSGLVELARRCAQATRYARDALLSLDRVEPFADAPVVREFALRLPVPAAVVIDRMADAGFLAGIPLGGEFEGGEHGLLVAVTERRTRDEIDAYVTRTGQGGGLMDRPDAVGRRPPPGARPTSAPLLGREAEPTLFELSHPGPPGLVVPDHRGPRGARRRAGPPSHRRRRARPGGRGLRARPGRPTSPGCPTASSRWTSGPTRWARAP